MKLFSKRNKRDDSRMDLYRSRSIHLRDAGSYYNRQRRSSQIVNSNVRIRLISLIKFLTSSDTFLEKYILTDNRKEKIHYLNKKLIDDFSESELGYKFSDFFDFYPFKFKGEWLDVEDSKKEQIYNDYFLFDLLETIILFSKEKQRNVLTIRIKKILEEEQTGFSIKESIIAKDSGEDLRSICTQLKDQKLVKKINSYYSFIRESDFVNASKISSEVLNIIISDEKKDKKKTMDDLWKKISGSIVTNTKEKDFINLFDEASKICQKLNNQIFDVRHSEEDRIKISNEYFYKLICHYNMSLVEVILTSLKDSYISVDNWEDIKNKYIENYKINKDTFYYIPEPEINNDVMPDDIPF